MENKKKTKAFWAVLVSSLALYLAMCWVHTFSMGVATWAYAVVYFAFTWFCIDIASAKGGLGAASVVMAVCLGRIALEVPIRILDFSGTIFSLLLLVVSMVSAVLAAICYRKKSKVVFAMTVVIMLFLNTFVSERYHDFCKERNPKVVSNY